MNWKNVLGFAGFGVCAVVATHVPTIEQAILSVVSPAALLFIPAGVIAASAYLMRRYQ